MDTSLYVRYMIFKNDRLDYRSYTLFVRMATSPVPQNFYCYKVSLTEINNRRFMGIDRYKSGGGRGLYLRG